MESLETICLNLLLTIGKAPILVTNQVAQSVGGCLSAPLSTPFPDSGTTVGLKMLVAIGQD